MQLGVGETGVNPWGTIVLVIVYAAIEVFHLAWTKKSATVSLLKELKRAINTLVKEICSDNAPEFLCGAWVSASLVVAFACLCYVFLQTLQRKSVLQSIVVFGALAILFSGLALLLYYINHRWIVPWLITGRLISSRTNSGKAPSKRRTQHPPSV